MSQGVRAQFLGQYGTYLQECLSSHDIVVEDWTHWPVQNEQSQIWVGTSAGQPTVVAKCHSHRPNGHREHLAYQRFLPHVARWLPPFYGFLDSDYSLLVLGWVNHVQIESNPTPAHHSSLGSFLGALHEVPCVDHDSLSLRDAIAMRWDVVMPGQGLGIPSRLIERITTLLSSGDPGLRVWCHRDFERRNWLWSVDDDRCCVIDFGQARPDTRAADWIYLTEQWLKEPETYHAFFDAYGGRLSRSEWASLLGLCGLHAAMSIRWGQRHQLRRPIESGRAILNWLDAHPFDDRLLP